MCGILAEYVRKNILNRNQNLQKTFAKNAKLIYNTINAYNNTQKNQPANQPRRFKMTKPSEKPKTYQYTPKFGTSTYTVTLEINNYAAGGTALMLVDEDQQLVSMASVKLDKNPAIPPDAEPHQMIWVKDYGENEGMLEFLTQNKIVELTGEITLTGFITVEAAAINPELF
jgi:ribosomal protein L24E